MRRMTQEELDVKETGRWSAVRSRHALGGSKGNFCWRMGARQLWRRKAGMYQQKSSCPALFGTSPFPWWCWEGLAAQLSCHLRLWQHGVQRASGSCCFFLSSFSPSLPFLLFLFSVFPSSFSYTTLRAHLGWSICPFFSP